MSDIIDGIADQIAALHISHWNDQDLLQKAHPILTTAPFRLGLKQESYAKVVSEMKRGLWINNNITTSHFKKYPLGAVAVTNTV